MSETIAIIGGGYSGTVLAVHLLRRCRHARIVLIERAERIGRGIAYAERDIPYLLNVPAQRLSADSGEPLQFLEFARTARPGAGPEDYLPRALYGRYLETLLAQAERTANRDTHLVRLHDEVLDLSGAPGEGFTIRLARGAPFGATRVVLAIGVPLGLPAGWIRPLANHPAYYPDPWSLPGHLDERHTVLIIGNGLTMADTAVALSWQRRSVPLLHTLSRRGLLSLSQPDIEPGVAPGAELMLDCAGSVRQLLHSSRAYAKDLARTGGDWREVVALIRQLMPRIWRALPHTERRRFLRHLRVYWDAHRHRLPPAVAARLHELRTAGRLEIHAGRVQAASAAGARIQVTWIPRGRTQRRSLEVDALVFATGPDAMLSRSPETLVRALERRELIAADALHLGLRVSAESECLNAAGTPVRNLYYLGPMLRAECWEAIATIELRDHAEALAERLGARSR